MGSSKVSGVRDQLLCAWNSQGSSGGEMDARVMASWMSRILAGQTTVAEFKQTLAHSDIGVNDTADDGKGDAYVVDSIDSAEVTVTATDVKTYTPSSRGESEGSRDLIRRLVRDHSAGFASSDGSVGVEDVEAAVSVICRMMTVPTAAVAAYMQLHMALDDPATCRMLAACETRFGRPLHVHEFLRHRAALYDQPACAGHGGLDAVVAALYVRHEQAVSLVCGVHRRLLGDVDFDELSFVKEYVGRPQTHRQVLDEPVAFAARLEGRVLAGSQYAEAVGARLRAIYATAIDGPLSDQVLRHLVVQARNLRIGPADPQDIEILLRLVADVSLQTGRFRARVADVYDAVLGRWPNDDEVIAAITADYEEEANDQVKVVCDRPRQAETLASLSAAEYRVGMRLASGLEFHDVIKRRLPVCPGPLLYSRLEAVVARLRSVGLCAQEDVSCTVDPLIAPFQLYFGWDAAVHNLLQQQ